VGARIMNLQDPEVRMSTTYGSEQGTVFILDEPEVVARKVRSAVTDSGTEVRRGPGKAGIANLIEIQAAVSGSSAEEIEREFDGSGYGDFKLAVAEAVVESLMPIRERYAELRGDEAALEKTLASGAAKAREIASQTLADVRMAVGVGPAM
jgi:tryptophanyl-tRNA synthetase